MEVVVDRLRAEMREFMALPLASGGCSDIFDIQAVWFGDPGIIQTDLYPCIAVDPQRDTQKSQSTGWEVRTLEIVVSVILDASEYFEVTEEEADGDRSLAQAADNLRVWFKALAKSRLDNMENIRALTVGDIQYLGQVRGYSIAKAAQITLLVDKQYQN